MNDWPIARLGDFIHVKHGYAFKGEHFASDGEEVVLTPGNFKVGGGLQFRAGKEKYYTGEFPPEFRLVPGQLLVVMTDLKQDAPILGSAARIPPRPPTLHNQRLGLVTVTNPNQVDERFLYHLLNEDSSRRQLRATATGTTVRHTAPKRIYEVQFALPTIDEQRTVASVLDSIDDLIENNRRRIEVLEEMAQAIYREWFVKFRFPGHEHATFVDSPLGPIPEGWETRKFGDLVDLRKKTVDPAEIADGSVLVGLEHIPRQQLTLDRWEQAAEVGSRKATFSRGDILFGKIRPYFHKVSIAPTDGYCSSDALVFRPRPGLEALAASIAFSKEFVDLASATANGTKMPRANWEVLASHEVPLPPPGLLEAFTALFSSAVKQCEAMMFANKLLSGIRDLLLPKLVTGEIDVSKLDLDALVGTAS